MLASRFGAYKNSLSALFLGPDTPEARLNDLDYARCIEQYGDMPVFRIDPDAVYEEEGLAGLEERVRDLVRTHNISIMFYGLGFEFNFRPKFLYEDLASVYRVLILGDDEHYFDVSHRYYAQCFDLVLTNNPLCERFHLYGIDCLFLPNVFSAELFTPDPAVAKNIDVSFVGAMTGKVGRQRYADALRRAGFDFRVYGSGTEAGMISQREVIDLYRRSRINLNFTGGNVVTPLDSRPDINMRVRQVKGRCAKIALCGSFILSEDAGGIDRLFAPGTEIDIFDNEKQLVEKVKRYLDDEDQRERMAARAHSRAREQYDEARFWPGMFATLRERMNRPRSHQPVCIDRPFWSAFGAWRAKYIVAFILTGKLRGLAHELALLVRTGRCNLRAAIWFGGMGLLAASKRSRFAASVALAVRTLRQALRRRLARHG